MQALPKSSDIIIAHLFYAQNFLQFCKTLISVLGKRTLDCKLQFKQFEQFERCNYLNICQPVVVVTPFPLQFQFVLLQKAILTLRGPAPGVQPRCM